MESGGVVRQRGVEVAQAAFQVEVGQVGGRAVAWTRDEHDIEVMRQDQPVEVRVDEIDAGAGAPVSQEPILDVLGPQRLAQQHVVAQVDLRTGEIVGGTQIACRWCVGHIRTSCESIATD